MAFRFSLLTLALATTATSAFAQSAPAQHNGKIKAAADHFTLDLPADQDPPPEVHLDPPDSATAPKLETQPNTANQTNTADQANAPNQAPAAEPAASPADLGASVPADVPPEAAPPPDSDAGDPSKVDAAPIPSTMIPASDVAQPAADAPVPAASDATQPMSDATEPATPDTATPDTATPGANSAKPATDVAPAPEPAADAPASSEAGDRPPASDTPPETGVGPEGATAPSSHAQFTLDTPIADLLADARAKAVLDKDMPGLSDDPNISKFKALSLRKFQPLTGGQLTDALLQRTANDLVLAASGNAPSSPDDLTPTTMPARTSGQDRFSKGR